MSRGSRRVRRSEVPPLAGSERERAKADTEGERLAEIQAATAEQDRVHARDRHHVWMRLVRQDLGIRKKYAGRVWTLSIVHLVAVALLVIADGSSCPEWEWAQRACFGFDVATPVMVALLGTTTATIIGLMYIVLRHHFPERPSTGA